MADAKPRLAEPRQQAQPGREIVPVMDLMKTQAMLVRFERYTPKGINFERLHASACLAIARDPALRRADPLQLVQAMMGVTNLGLMINSPEGHCYLIAYGQEKVTLQVVIGYRGFIELAYRAGDLIKIGGDIATMDECAAGRFVFQKGTEDFLRHTFLPTRDEQKDEPAFAYAVAHLKDGVKFDVMPWPAILRIRNGSDGYQYALSKGSGSKVYEKNPWIAHTWQMGVKSVLRRMTKTMHLSPDMARAVALDEIGEGRDGDLSEVVDLDPREWNDLTDALKREQEGRPATTTQTQARTPQPEKTAAAGPANGAAEAPQQQKPAANGAASPAAAPAETRQPPQQQQQQEAPPAGGAAGMPDGRPEPPAANSLDDYWN